MRWLPFGAVSAFAAGIIVWLGRDLTFTWDECVYIARGWGVLRPHNEHWMTVPLVAWKTWMALFGVGSYWPFHILLLAVYAVMAAGVYALLGGLYAVSAVALLWFLGSGADQLMWAVQISFVGSVAAGVWALWSIERSRGLLAAVLLTIAVASSGIGLAFIPAAIVLGVVRRDRGTVWLVLPILVYSAWYLVFGLRSQLDPSAVPSFVVGQVLSSSSALSGLPGFLGVSVALFAMTRARDPLVLACLVGILAEFALIGLVRAEGAPRYHTAFAAFALLAIGRTPWPSIMRPVGYLVLAWALTVNVGGLIAYTHEFALWVTSPGRLC